MRVLRFFALFTCLLGLFLSSPAAAQDPNSAEARGCYERGQRYYDLGSYDNAIKEFKRGYLLSGLPAFLLNIAQAYRMQGDVGSAIEYYRRFLERAEPEDPSRPGAEKILAELEAKGSQSGGATPKPGVPAYDGGLSQAEIEVQLGAEYQEYLASGLTYESYRLRERAYVRVWTGVGIATGAAALGVTFIVIDRSERGALTQLGGLLVLTGGSFGLSITTRGLTQVQQANTRRRPPVAAAISLVPAGAALAVSF